MRLVFLLLWILIPTLHAAELRIKIHKKRKGAKNMKSCLAARYTLIPLVLFLGATYVRALPVSWLSFGFLIVAGYNAPNRCP